VRLIVLRKTRLNTWKLVHKDYEDESTKTLSEWLEFFRKDEAYTWKILHVTTEFIILERKKIRRNYGWNIKK